MTELAMEFTRFELARGEALALLSALQFRTRTLGRSRALVVPQRVGRWWLEPLTDASSLPSRARQRLAAVLEAGIDPAAVVLFHELQVPGHRPSRFIVLASRVASWSQQELPVLVERAGRAAAVVLPIVGWALLRVSIQVAKIVGMVAFAVAMGVGSVLAAGFSDPCLVIVTKEGDWIEIDRWVS